LPATQVATLLTAEGVPTPDHGRTRTDRGVKHPTAGVWRQSVVTGIARNPLVAALVSYGRRSMGDQARSRPEGRGRLEAADRDAEGQPRVVRTPEGGIDHPAVAGGVRAAHRPRAAAAAGGAAGRARRDAARQAALPGPSAEPAGQPRVRP